MEPITRRTMIAGAAFTSALMLQENVNAKDKDATTKANAKATANKSLTDRDHVIASGMTESEADCWELTAKAAGAFFKLPMLHPEDQKEVANAIHLIQNKLLSRPTYRKYLELAKAAHRQK